MSGRSLEQQTSREMGLELYEWEGIGVEEWVCDNWGSDDEAVSTGGGGGVCNNCMSRREFELCE